MAIIVLAPVLVGISFAVALTSRGPMLFRQVRIGRHGKPFVIHKFRTMRVDAEEQRAEVEHLNESDGTLFKVREDPRVTPIGRYLRRFSLDELPQFFDVLLGRMSLVGPRPPLPTEVDRYASLVRTAAGRQAGDHRALAGVGTVGPVVGRVGSTRPALRRELVAGPRHHDHAEDGAGRAPAPRRLLTAAGSAYGNQSASASRTPAKRARTRPADTRPTRAVWAIGWSSHSATGLMRPRGRCVRGASCARGADVRPGGRAVPTGRTPMRSTSLRELGAHVVLDPRAGAPAELSRRPTPGGRHRSGRRARRSR